MPCCLILIIPTTVYGPPYIAMTAFTNHSSTPAFLRAHLVTSLGTLSNAFSRITKAKYSFFPLLSYFFCIHHMVKIASVVPFPDINPNCISSIFALSLILHTDTCSVTFIAWPRSFIAVFDPHSIGSPGPRHFQARCAITYIISRTGNTSAGNIDVPCELRQVIANSDILVIKIILVIVIVSF